MGIRTNSRIVLKRKNNSNAQLTGISLAVDSGLQEFLSSLVPEKLTKIVYARKIKVPDIWKSIGVDFHDRWSDFLDVDDESEILFFTYQNSRNQKLSGSVYFEVSRDDAGLEKIDGASISLEFGMNSLELFIASTEYPKLKPHIVPARPDNEKPFTSEDVEDFITVIKNLVDGRTDNLIWG